MNLKELLSPNNLIQQLENLKEKKYVFRGQPNRQFFLLPNAFRVDTIRKMSCIYPSTNNYYKWRESEELQKIIELYLKDNKRNHLVLMNSARLHELTLYLLQYNFFISKYVKQFEEKFDFQSRKMNHLHSPSFWTDEKTFMNFFEFALRMSTGIKLLNGEIKNNSEINEILTAHDETLPQHYGVSTAAIDWTLNPYIAIFFASKDVPKNTKEIAIYAYKEIKNSICNPISLVFGNPDCKNQRIINQEGLFMKIRYACIYYYMNGDWPSVEKFIPKNVDHFDLIKLTIDIGHIDSLRQICENKKLTNEFLFPEKEYEFNYDGQFVNA